MIWDESVIVDNADFRVYVAFPGKATPAITDDTRINFAPDGVAATSDDDATCTGTVAAPTAPSGKVCIYWVGSAGVDNVDGRRNYVNARDGFYVSALSAGTVGQDMYLTFSWAYRAP